MLRSIDVLRRLFPPPPAALCVRVCFSCRMRLDVSMNAVMPQGELGLRPGFLPLVV